jgi:hypothetical protein
MSKPIDPTSQILLSDINRYGDRPFPKIHITYLFHHIGTNISVAGRAGSFPDESLRFIEGVA